MEEILLDRAAEAPHHQTGQQQRHREIEIPAQEPLERILRPGSFFQNRRRTVISVSGECCRHKISQLLIAGVAPFATSTREKTSCPFTGRAKCSLVWLETAQIRLLHSVLRPSDLLKAGFWVAQRCSALRCSLYLAAEGFSR